MIPLRIREERWALGLESPWPSAEVWIGLIRERNEQRVQRKEVGNGFLGKRGKRVGIAKRITFLDLLRFCSAAILLYYFQARRRQKWTESRRRIARSSLFTRRTQDLRMHSLPFEYLDERGIPLEFHWIFCVIAPLHRFSNVFDIFKRFGTVIYIHRFYNKHYSHPLPRFFLWYVATAFFMLDMMSC